MADQQAQESSSGALGDPMEAWKARGRKLNALYDVIRQAMGRHKMTDDPLADLKTLVAERDRFRNALESINDLEGKVCAEYEICEHIACQSSYGAWSYANGALHCADPLGEEFGDG